MKKVTLYSNKQPRMYHSGWQKHGTVLSIKDGWVTVRMDGDQGTTVYEVNAPYITIEE